MGVRQILHVVCATCSVVMADRVVRICLAAVREDGTEVPHTHGTRLMGVRQILHVVCATCFVVMAEGVV